VPICLCVYLSIPICPLVPLHPKVHSQKSDNKQRRGSPLVSSSLMSAPVPMSRMLIALPPPLFGSLPSGVGHAVI